MFLWPHVSSDLPTESTLPDAPPELEDRVAILAGGFSPFFPNSPSTEAFPSAGCLPLPALPQFRGGHALFPTAEENPSIVACGGTDENRYFHPACPVFDLDSQRWEEGRIPPLLLPRVGLAAVSLKDIGIFLIGGGGNFPNSGAWYSNEQNMDFLAKDSQQWSQLATPQIMNSPCTVDLYKAQQLFWAFSEKQHFFQNNYKSGIIMKPRERKNEILFLSNLVLLIKEFRFSFLLSFLAPQVF